MDNSFEIRLIEDADIPEVLELYSYYVINTYITFDYEVPTLEEYTLKVRHIMLEYPWLVCLCNGKIIGYVYGSRHRAKTAYQWSPESTIYMHQDFQGRGVGRLLYQTLFSLLRLQGYFNVYAGVGMPNDRSEKLHMATGFEVLGVFSKVGYKLGKWHDTKWFQLALAEHVDNPPLPELLDQVRYNDEFISIIESANKKLNTPKQLK